MKGIIIIFGLILLIGVVYADCSDLTVEEIYINETASCENLESIRIIDSSCEPFPPPGNCWNGFEKAILAVPDNIEIIDSSIEYEFNLESDKTVYDWTYVRCSEVGDYEIRIIFDNTCEKTLILDFTEEVAPQNDDQQQDQGTEPRRDSSRSSVKTGGVFSSNPTPYNKIEQNDQEVQNITVTGDNDTQQVGQKLAEEKKSKKSSLSTIQIVIITLLAILIIIIVILWILIALTK